MKLSSEMTFQDIAEFLIAEKCDNDTSIEFRFYMDSHFTLDIPHHATIEQVLPNASQTEMEVFA